MPLRRLSHLPSLTSAPTAQRQLRLAILRGKGTDETLRQSELIAKGNVAIQAANRIIVDVPEVDRQTVSRTIDAMVAADPDLAWLKAMEARGDVDWRRVKEIHDSWSYEQSGLGAGAALAIAIVAATFVGPAAAGMVGATSTAGAAAAAALGAGAASLASTGAISLINNRGDLGDAFSDTLSSDSLRGALLAAASAGMAHNADVFWGGSIDVASGTTQGLDIDSLSGFGNFAGNRLSQAAANAGLETAINGGSLGDNLEAGLQGAVAHVASGVLFNAVGDLAIEQGWPEGGPQKIALHALVGGLVAETSGGDFRDGALAAGASEALVGKLIDNVNDNPALTNAVAQLVGLTAAGLAGGDVQRAAWAANQADRYNRQLHPSERELAQSLAAKSGGKFTAEEIEQALRGSYNSELGKAPGNNTVVDLASGNEAVEVSYYDFGGEWIATSGESGTSRYLVQVVPSDTDPDLLAFIHENTGGFDSPYISPVHMLPPEPAAPGQPRDRLTGRPLDESGRYTVSYVVDGEVYHVPHFPCGDLSCTTSGANVDRRDPVTQAWDNAVNIKALDDFSRLATAGVLISPAGPIGTGLANIGTSASLLSGYLKDDFPSAASKEAMMLGFERYAVGRGVPASVASKLNAALSLSGVWDEVLGNGKSMLGLSNE